MAVFISAVSLRNLLRACKTIKVIYPEKDKQGRVTRLSHTLTPWAVGSGKAGGCLRQQAARGQKGLCEGITLLLPAPSTTTLSIQCALQQQPHRNYIKKNHPLSPAFMPCAPLSASPPLPW